MDLWKGDGTMLSYYMNQAFFQNLNAGPVMQMATCSAYYGDPAYPLRPQLQAPFPTAHITPDQSAFNAAMSKVRITVEWSFGDVINFFKLTDFNKTQNILLSPCGKMYIVSGILTNAHSCIYRNNTSFYFELVPPSLEEYFQ